MAIQFVVIGRSKSLNTIWRSSSGKFSGTTKTRVSLIGLLSKSKNMKIHNESWSPTDGLEFSEMSQALTKLDTFNKRTLGFVSGDSMARTRSKMCMIGSE